MHVRRQALAAHLAPAQQVSQAAHVVPRQISQEHTRRRRRSCRWDETRSVRWQIDRDRNRFAENIRGGRGQGQYMDIVAVQFSVHIGGGLSRCRIEVAFNDVEGVIRARGVCIEVPNAVIIAYWISEAHLFKQEAQCYRLQINKIQGAGCAVITPDRQGVVRQNDRRCRRQRV